MLTPRTQTATATATAGKTLTVGLAKFHRGGLCGIDRIDFVAIRRVSCEILPVIPIHIRIIQRNL